MVLHLGRGLGSSFIYDAVEYFTSEIRVVEKSFARALLNLSARTVANHVSFAVEKGFCMQMAMSILLFIPITFV